MVTSKLSPLAPSFLVGRGDDLKFPEDKPLRRVRVWYEIALALLKKFCDRFYKNEKARYQAGFIEYAELAEDDGNFFSEYHFEVEESKTEMVDTLNRIKGDLEDGSFSSPDGFHAFACSSSGGICIVPWYTWRRKTTYPFLQ